MVLLGILVFDVWWRGHTFGPTVRDRMKLTLWPVVEGESEPLDCDEAAYGYIGRRLLNGDVMYRDLTENKPPGGYWIYEAAIALGDANEITIRILPIPLVLLTIVLLWWIGLWIAGPGAGCLSAFVYAVLSTDPYLYGNGANLEHAINLFSVASLAILVSFWKRSGGFGPFLAGVLLAGATLVKQVAVVNLPLFATALWLRRDETGVVRSMSSRGRDLSALCAGFVLPWAIAIGVLVGQGAGPSAFEDIVRYGSAMATDTPAGTNAPSALVRWLTGNSDPRTGALPWPFGTTDWLVWWGTGSWPLWIASVPAMGWFLFGPTNATRRLVAGWTLSAWVQVILPGMFWAHYYLLPTPGIALLVATLLTDGLTRVRDAFRSRRPMRGLFWLIVSLAVGLAVLGTVLLQVRDYLLVPPEQLTVRYKGGAQWVRLRQIGRQLASKSKVWESPHLYVWGWQSPLYFYSGLDSPTRHFFANELLKAYAGRNHPLVSRWTEEIMSDLQANPPELIFTGDPPFPALRDYLVEGYRVSRLVPEAPVLWVERSRFLRFERSGRPMRAGLGERFGSVDSGR